MNTQFMPTDLKAVGDEPLPGYRLLEPLGAGGFGEVWKCEAPGGLLKAIKFVKGTSGGLDGGKGDSAALEFQAIQRVKAVRHPFLLSLERVEVLDGELVLVMELAERNLADRFAECQAAGQLGIGRDELLAYLTEAAEALDLMNLKHGLQHLDVKPANLFIVSNHLKVADFGLVNSLEELPADGPPKQLGGLTPLYVAPEMLRGKMSRHSDQYSLAIVYQALLTGTHPFPGDNPRKIMLAHLMSEPDLGALPETDQPLVARALAKDPEHRFPSCLHFVQALVFGIDPDADASDVRRPAQFRRTTPTPIPPTKSSTTVVTKRPSRAAFAGAPQPSATAPNTVPAGGETKREVRPHTGLTMPGLQMLVQVGRGPLGELYTGRDAQGRQRQVRYLPAGEGALAPDRWSLSRLSSLHDPALPKLEVELLANGRLALVADAPEQTLLDRFDECVADGQKGVPRAELLHDLAAAAEALDALRGERFQHLALNPRALLRQDGRAQIGDFGLAQLLWLPHWETVPHPHRSYAAPELLQGTANPTCDAYSLALIFAEMLTGVHPTPNRLRSRAATSGRPDLAWLPVTDRAAIARALDPDPTRRFQSCVELLDALGATRSRSGEVPRLSMGDELAFIRPFANLFGGKECRPAGLPSIQRIVTRVVLAETSSVTMGVANKLPYLRRNDNVLETRFPIRLLPGVVRLKMDAFCEKWEAKIESQTDRSFVLRLQESGNFWRRCFGQKTGLEIRLDLQPTRGVIHTSEATATVQPFGGAGHLSAQKLQEAGPLLLVSLRDDLQNTPDQRGQVRWPCSPAIDVYPLEADGRVTNVMQGKCKDLSFSGLAFTTAQRLPGAHAYVHLKTFPELVPFVFLARVVRADACDGGYKNGAAFVPSGLEQL